MAILQFKQYLLIYLLFEDDENIYKILEVVN